MIELPQLSNRELLALHANVVDELRVRGISRSANNPTGDLAEYLFCKAFNWVRAENSHPNVDAVGPDGLRYQIKGRRTTRFNNSRQLGAIRELSGKHFDSLAAVLFDQNYDVMRAVIVPHAVVEARSTYVAHTNSHKFILRDDIWLADGVRDVTPELKAIAL